jgi:hypothetical protein
MRFTAVECGKELAQQRYVIFKYENDFFLPGSPQLQRRIVQARSEAQMLSRLPAHALSMRANILACMAQARSLHRPAATILAVK